MKQNNKVRQLNKQLILKLNNKIPRCLNYKIELFIKIKEQEANQMRENHDLKDQKEEIQLIYKNQIN